ncbi:MAG: flagellar export protein FliJ [Sulfurospirillum sp.]
MPIVFSKISKINRQKLDKLESELFMIKSEIKKIKRNIKETYSYIDNLIIPQNGTIKEFNVFAQRRKVLNLQKDRQKRDLHKKEVKLSHKYEEYKKAKLEYEKIKYLKEQEIAKKLKKIKKDEQKELDEMSNLLFKRNKQ